MARAEFGNTIHRNPIGGFYMNVFDIRPETMKFMKANSLQGGGPTWMALITAALQLESPETFDAVEFDDEAEVVLVKSASESSLKQVQSYVSRLMTDASFMQQCISKAKAGGYLE
jgi:hypothetical protein